MLADVWPGSIHVEYVFFFGYVEQIFAFVLAQFDFQLLLPIL